jgi:hypothetical protein
MKENGMSTARRTSTVGKGRLQPSEVALPMTLTYRRASRRCAKRERKKVREENGESRGWKVQCSSSPVKGVPLSFRVASSSSYTASASCQPLSPSSSPFSRSRTAPRPLRPSCDHPEPFEAPYRTLHSSLALSIPLLTLLSGSNSNEMGRSRKSEGGTAQGGTALEMGARVCKGRGTAAQSSCGVEPDFALLSPSSPSFRLHLRRVASFVVEMQLPLSSSSPSQWDNRLASLPPFLAAVVPSTFPPVGPSRLPPFPLNFLCPVDLPQFFGGQRNLAKLTDVVPPRRTNFKLFFFRSLFGVTDSGKNRSRRSTRREGIRFDGGSRIVRSLPPLPLFPHFPLSFLSFPSPSFARTGLGRHGDDDDD